jgi:hypothetical protein
MGQLQASITVALIDQSSAGAAGIDDPVVRSKESANAAYSEYFIPNLREGF